MDKISIIVPCYNEEKVLSAFYRETTAAVKDITDAECEFIFVDDGSRDRTPEILHSLSLADERCKYISFSRNFGKEAAMYAGLQNASGDYCVFMDADLQHPPKLLKEMYNVVKNEGYGRLCRLDMTDGAGDFRMMNRTMADSILELKEYNRYMKGIFSFVGFDTKWIPFHNVERAAGKTKWTFRSLFRYALDGILSFSSAPATLAGTAGFFLIAAAFIIGIATLLIRHSLPGLTLVICLLFFLSGIQMFFIAILGQYIARDYMESKKRPIYIIKKKGGF